MRRQTIEEYKAVIIGAPQRFSCELLWRAAGQAVVIYRLPKAVQLQHLRLAAGTVSYGYFGRHDIIMFIISSTTTTKLLRSTLISVTLPESVPHKFIGEIWWWIYCTRQMVACRYWTSRNYPQTSRHR